ncbi:MAG TPA: O-acetyl-ADP-ribose deacetylase [Marinilabiliales bacterium]|jgi:O-acetyl-ADP-ribose deacetylase (regulator of RNase III)|nr:O-acetyl-ADP-ribose deacetylase [Salinivirgaceae bacterium]OFX42443.1 MAG: O-acetyl-ADP-ribose deacetylase [Bacteroidetes bacterium GWA2_40_14]OFX61885.1 MAG: O-acetyl-ADP-ribose deacetylase [Bacteroidetes bacterium GWC2_40_13]OFX74032.1 MAG: O-acetyl-ADP-ribose deacetylase [Bacteroidetes bacterium GWD2_40_43]OFX93133.1 MAG: O-acetyl-ADP-ribose deacetylase [Bacteroidetes bacterium GWE2_40_63]OFY21503.1 MAG: O-acetyl-ADP-ribose deacetylase [Bacteroidetes bacterium GWF2_40_13]OFZ24157.1 MAG:
MHRIEILQGDITKIKADAIVNAANQSLLGGGGVDGAIHRAAGPQLLDACRLLHGCPTGEAKITNGFNLPSPHVIHTVGPVWHGGKKGEAELLASCYTNSLKVARSKHLKTIAFPNISTGIYGYPKPEAAKIALSVVKNFLKKDRSFQKVIFVIFEEENFKIYRDLYKIND